jgi:topoisomerase IA-like protein
MSNQTSTAEIISTETSSTPVAIKVEKIDHSIIVKTLNLPKEITVNQKSSCTVFTNANGVRWYLKGTRTLETTKKLPLKAFMPFSDERIANCHLGNSVGIIKLEGNKNLEDILSTHFLKAVKPAKVSKATAKVEVAKVEAVKPVKASKKSAKKVIPVIEAPAITPAPETTLAA